MLHRRVFRFLNTIWDFIKFCKNRPAVVKGTPWDSTVAAASEEWVDETDFSFRPKICEERLFFLFRLS